MNKPISYPLAKLLKEKGFDEPCPNLYYQPERCKKPTIAEVVMWLYEKHGIWVSVSVDTLFNKGKFCILIYKDKGLGLENYPLDNTEFSPYESPTEAYEVAIEYTLTKLI
jgi:hypothetical protein